MSDIEAIQQLLNRYTLCANLADYAAMADCYAPDGVWNIESMGMAFTGAEAIIAKSRDVEDKFDFVVQQNTPAVIEVDGDRAHARAMVRESSKYADCDRMLEVFGLYTDELVRIAGEWKFARRNFRLLNVVEYDSLTPIIFERAKEWNK